MLKGLGNVEVLSDRRQTKRPKSSSVDVIDEAQPPQSSARSPRNLDETDDCSDEHDTVQEYEVEAIRCHRSYRVSDAKKTKQKKTIYLYLLLTHCAFLIYPPLESRPPVPSQMEKLPRKRKHI